jgi:RNA polymerase sigma-70 factor (ECF subfamily)
VDPTDARSALASQEPSPETRTLAGEQANRVQLALKSLSPKQRIVFIMRFLDEMELQEISAITGLLRRPLRSRCCSRFITGGSLRMGT